MPWVFLMVLFSLKRPDQPAPLKKKNHAVHCFWLVIIEKLQGSKKTTFIYHCKSNVCSCVKYLQGFPLKKATYEIPPGIFPFQKAT